MSGFVDTVLFTKCPVNSKHVFLKGCVSPSQKLRDDPHKVWVCLEDTKNDCKIVTSWCTCTAGTAEVCNHVIALMYKVNFALACVASVPVRFKRKENSARVLAARKMGRAQKMKRGEGDRREGNACIQPL